MNRTLMWRRLLRARRDLRSGFTLTELLVAMGLFSVVSTMLVGFVVSVTGISSRLQDGADISQESRLAVQRLERELRQTQEVRSVTLTSLGARVNSMTLAIDFDGDGVITVNEVDPEVLTYRWEPSTEELTLVADDPDGETISRPVLTAGVSDFDITLGSSAWQYDANRDGVTTWQELDASTIGNNNNQPDAAELRVVDIISVRMVVDEGESSRTFNVQADLRNTQIS